MSVANVKVAGAYDADSGEFEYWMKPDCEGFEDWKGQMEVLGHQVIIKTIAELALYLQKPPRNKKKLH